MGKPGLLKNPLIKWGLPLVSFCVAGYLGLSLFVAGTVEVKDHRVKKRSERAVELERNHKAIVGQLNLGDYEIKPISRPPEA